MCISFSSESNPLYKNSFVSRFLIFMMPVSKYYIQGKKKEETNLSLQEALKIIAASLNKLGVEGSHGLRGVCTPIRGDWKWLVQAAAQIWTKFKRNLCCVQGNSWLAGASDRLERLRGGGLNSVMVRSGLQGLLWPTCATSACGWLPLT